MAIHSIIKDTGAFFTIVPETREVTVPATHKVIGVVGDHLAEQLTFEIPKLIDGHDISGCARRFVEWANVEGERGSDQLVELTERPASARPEMLYFTWTIRDRLAAAKGLVQFSLHFEDVDESGVRLYHWGTTVCKNCEILDSINHTLGAYKAIWVAGDTLVIEDYTPVDDKTLALETPGIVPEGTLEITNNGTHDVGLYAQVKVVVPEAETEMANGLIVNNSSVEIFVDFCQRDRTNFNTGTKQVSVTVAPGESYAVEDAMRYTSLLVYDGRDGQFNLPTHLAIQYGVLTRIGPGTLGLSVDDMDFSVEIINA